MVRPHIQKNTYGTIRHIPEITVTAFAVTHLLRDSVYCSAMLGLQRWPKSHQSIYGWANIGRDIFYIAVCKTLKIEIVREDAKRFREHFGSLDDARDYFVLEYPFPPPVDLTNIDMGNMPREQIPVLAPYFSAVLRHRQTGKVKYYTLGQSSMGGGTTLRAVTASGENCNLGGGPEPQLDAFLATLRSSR
jgi:hypothetical protein